MAPAKSVFASKLNSGINSPGREDQILDSEFTSPLFSAQLQDRLKQFIVEDADNPEKKNQGSAKNGLIHSIEVLSQDRRKSSELAREQALGSLLRHLATKYDPAIIHYDLFVEIVSSFTNARTEIESVIALQLICVAITMVEGSDDSRSADCFDLVNQLQQSLPKRIDECESVDVKQTMIVTFAVLTYFMNAGGGGYGIEAAVSRLMEIAESVSGAENTPVTAAALNGAALLTTLASAGSAGVVANDWIFSLVPMLNVTQIPARLAAVTFAAVLFERADPQILLSGEYREACEEVVQTLEELSQESVVRTGKTNRKAHNMLLRSVTKTCQHILNKDKPEELVDAEDPRDIVSHYHKHVVSKNFGITTWAALSVVEHLTWVFGPGIHNQLANNPYIKSLLHSEDVQVESADGPVNEDDAEQQLYRDSPEQKDDAAKRSRQLQKQRLEKAETLGMV